MNVSNKAKNDSKTVDIPLPSKELQISVVQSQFKIEVDEIFQEKGHFSVDYRRC